MSGAADEILLISHFILEIHCTSGLLLSSILNSGSRLMLNDISNAAVESSMVANVGLAIGISLIFRLVSETQCTPRLLSAMLNFSS